MRYRIFENRDMSHPQKMEYATSTENGKSHIHRNLCILKTEGYPIPCCLAPYLIPPRELADARRSFRYKAVGVLFRGYLIDGVLVLGWQWRESHALAWLGLHPRPVNRTVCQTSAMLSKCQNLAKHLPNYRKQT